MRLAFRLVAEESRLPSPAWVGHTQSVEGLNRTKGLLPPANSSHTTISLGVQLANCRSGTSQLPYVRANSYNPPSLSVYMLLLLDLSSGDP